MKNKNILGTNLRQNGMIIALVFITLLFGILTKGTMFRPMNVSNIFMQNSYIIILAIGMFFCELTGGNVDLSVGSVVAVSGALMGVMTVQNDIPVFLAILITLVCGILIGMFQGAFIAYFNVPPFIATLAGMLIFRGLTQVILQGQSLSPFSSGYQYFAAGFLFPDFRIGGVNVLCAAVFVTGAAALIWMERKKRMEKLKYGFETEPLYVVAGKTASVILVMGLVLFSLSAYEGMPMILLVLIVMSLFYSYIASNTRIGRHIYMIGGNRRAAELSGVKAKRVMFIVYINVAFLATIAGLVVSGRLNAATPKAGNSYELDAIAACMIGGVSATGGAGTIAGAIIGAAVIAILNNGMSIMGIGTDMQQVIKGLILLLAVTFDIYSKSKSTD